MIIRYTGTTPTIIRCTGTTPTIVRALILGGRCFLGLVLNSGDIAPLILVLFYFCISKMRFMFELIFRCFLCLRGVCVCVWVSGNVIVGVIGFYSFWRS